MKIEPRPYSSSLFTQVVRKRVEPQEPQFTPSSSLLLECRCANVDPSLTLAVAGEGEMFGWWGASGVLPMADSEFPLWRLPLEGVSEPVEFKFVLIDRLTHEIRYWEEGYNRILRSSHEEEDRTLETIECHTPIFDTPLWRGVGVSIPIFSLRSEASMGVGDFADLRKMVDWAADREMCVIQILPINDTIMDGSWMDSYPYNSNSTIALHPQYISLREVGELSNDNLREEFERRASELNALPSIDYPAMMRLKMEYLRMIFAQEGAETINSAEYITFVESNSWWLEPYALYSHLRDSHNSCDFTTWEGATTYSPNLLQQFSAEGIEAMNLYKFIQYHLHRQLLTTVEYARSRGVAIKGDIPIGVSRTSVEVWQYPDLFRLDMQAGAPPDPFSALGQNWGFPTYNWDLMARDGYMWWVSRMRKMAEYFDAYRIDHILGLFRIWEIPLGSVQGLVGHFAPALPLSPRQIKEWGVGFKKYLTEPYITTKVLSEHFSSSEEIKFVKKSYLEPSSGGRYRFREEYNTQRKIVDLLEESPLRERLVSLHNEVLFVEDGSAAGMYHPRIAGYDTYVFRSLDEEQQRAFSALHHDFYYVRHNDFWRDSAMSKLPTLINSTSMLVCGEDLGMIPACVEDVMRELEILSLEIERMPKQFGVTFGEPAHYPYLSVATTSTHDMTTMRGWWQEDAELTRRYYCEALNMADTPPVECSAEIARMVVDRHINSNSMLVILPWQDWMAMDAELRNPDVDAERINVPANSRHYWRYRMHLTL